MTMFENLGPALRLARELRGRRQADVARKAGVGKSQLSKYENGKDLPRLDSLERILDELGVSAFGFFYTLHLIDEGALVFQGKSSPGASPMVLGVEGLVAPETDAAFQQIMKDLLGLYQAILAQNLRIRKPNA